MTMMDDQVLRQRLEALLADDRTRRDERSTEIRHEMHGMEARLARFEAVAREWMDRLIVPKLETLAALFANRRPMVRTGSAYRVEQAFGQTEDFPADALVEVSLTFDIAAERIRLTFEASIIPILMEYEREGMIEYGLGTPDPGAVGPFLDERIVRFVQDYLRLREPDSPYQKDRRVTDPVCGMTLRRAEAAATLEHGGRTYHFCVPECRERFAADPERFMAALGRPTGCL
ncbi:MAG: YHS domain-containing protein [candidate division NC10 bacterium]